MGYPSRKYRVGAYRRRNWRNVVIIILALVVALFVAFFVLGNRLNSKSDKATAKTKPSSYATQDAPAETVPLDYSVNAYAVDISGMIQSDFSEAVKNISSEGVNAVSVNFTSRDGSLLYSSAVAESLGYQSSEQELLSASSIVSSANSKGFFVSGYMSVNSHKESDGKVAAVRRSYEAAIACELIEKGVKDVVIRCDDLNVEDIESLVALGDAIKEINSEAEVGLALNKAILSAEKSALYVDKLKKSYSFICFDLGAEEGEDIVAQIGNAVSENQLYILRDNIRILLPLTDEETLEDISGLLAANNVSNWQVVLK